MNTRKHYIAMSGDHGCIPDFCSVYTTFDAAVESLTDMFGLGRTRRANLKNNRSLELNNSRDGAEYCEITACTCATPWIHDENVSQQDWETREESTMQYTLLEARERYIESNESFIAPGYHYCSAHDQIEADADGCMLAVENGELA